jgi:putative membrane protein
MRTTFHHQSINRRLWVKVFGLGLYSSLAVYKEFSLLEQFGDVPINIHALLGVVLSVLLVFRTNTAYDRWWEGRKLWGQLLNDSRNLVIKVKHLVKVDSDEKWQFAHLVSSFAYALKEHLREPVKLQSLPGFEKSAANPRHVPAHLISLLYDRLSTWKEQGKLDGFTALLLDRQAAAFADILGGCERIRNTPLVSSYRTYVRQCLFLYLFTLPWGLVHEFSYWTIPVTMIVSYFMLGLEMIARAVEEPFGTDPDDLPLDEICDRNEATLTEIMDQPVDPSNARES